jgi:gas vesicle protein
MTNGKAILAVLAVVAAGAALGVFFAPDKGVDIRKKISRKGEDLADALNDKIDEKFDELLAAITGKVKKHIAPSDAVLNKKEMAD